jgi:hypothetical protein
MIRIYRTFQIKAILENNIFYAYIMPDIGFIFERFQKTFFNNSAPKNKK